MRPATCWGRSRGTSSRSVTTWARCARGLLARLLDSGGELVTVVAGEGADALAAEVAAYVESQHPGVDVSVYEGGQERYPLLLAVE